MFNLKSAIVLGSVLLLAWSCVTPFTPEAPNYENVVVIDARLTNGPERARVKLSRSLPLEQGAEINPIFGARAWVEEEGGESFELLEIEPGLYQNTILMPEDGEAYRMMVQLPDGETYESSWETFESGPEITTIEIEANQQLNTEGNLVDGLSFFLTTEDPRGVSQFYQWEWEETWLYITPFPSTAEIITFSPFHVRLYPLALLPDSCWRTLPNPSVILANTQNQAQARVDRKELVFISAEDNRLFERYSLLVKQYRLTEEAYQYWELLKRVNEEGGSLFAPIPQRVRGNWTAQDDPDEIVVGYFTVGGEYQQRVFTSKAALPDPRIVKRGFVPCEFRGFTYVNLEEQRIDEYLASVYVTNRGFVYHDTLRSPISGSPIGFEFVERRCGDCRSTGGVMEQPDFW